MLSVLVENMHLMIIEVLLFRPFLLGRQRDLSSVESAVVVIVDLRFHAVLDP